MKSFSLIIAARARRLLPFVTSLLTCSFAANAEPPMTDAFALRNQNPFLQVFGLPPFQSTALAAEGKPEYKVNFDLVNHAEARVEDVESAVFDGETYFLTLSARRRVTPRLELGIDVPMVRHTDGVLDNVIEDWHDTFGMSNSNRSGPSNELDLFYASDGNTLYEINSPTFGIGDIQLTAAIPLRMADESNDFSMVVRANVKLPTGSEEDLHGSGAADFAAGLYLSDNYSLFERNLALSGFAGALLLGDGDVLTELQRDTVPYAGVAATWQATENLAVTTQVYAQGEYFDSELREVGGDTMQLTIGGSYRLPQQGWVLSFAIIEDPIADSTPDFGLHFSIRNGGGR